jgi:hypothetical protein
MLIYLGLDTASITEVGFFIANFLFFVVSVVVAGVFLLVIWVRVFLRLLRLLPADDVAKCIEILVGFALALTLALLNVLRYRAGDGADLVR